MRPWGKKRFRAWRSRRRVVRNQQLLDTATGTRVIGANLTTLEAPAPEARSAGHLRVW